MEHQNGEERGLSDYERVLVVGASWALYHRFRLVLMVLGILSWHTLGPLVPVERPLNTASYRSIVADHVRPFMSTADQLLLATFSMIMPQISCHLILEHDIEFTVPPRSPDLSPIEHLWDVRCTS